MNVQCQWRSAHSDHLFPPTRLVRFPLQLLALLQFGRINEQVTSWWTHRIYRATPTVCSPLSRSRLHTGTAQCLESGPPRCATWRCARGWSSPSGYEKSRQPLLVAVDTRRHPVNAQRSLEINPVCMSILARQKNTDTDTELPVFITHTHTQPNSWRFNFDPSS